MPALEVKAGNESTLSLFVKKLKPQTQKITPPKNLKKVTSINTANSNLFDDKLIVGNIVEHMKFGKGEVIQIEGVGNNKKAEIKFETGATKKLLLHFAKLKIIG